MAYIKRTKSEGKIAHKKTIIDGIQFDSKMESEYYLYLKEEQKAGRVKSFTLQPEFILQPKYFVLNGEIITNENEEYYAIKDKERKKHRRIKFNGGKINATYTFRGTYCNTCNRSPYVSVAGFSIYSFQQKKAA